MTSSRSFVVLVVVAWLAGLARAEAADEKFRLAVLAEDTATESRSVADLMTVELGKQASVELVDRAEIDRVLAEQKLSASGLLDVAQRISVGKLLRADGLVFLGTDQQRKRLLTRVVETRYGYLAGQFTQNLTTNKLAEVAQGGAARIVQVIPKLRLNPSDRTLVSLWRFQNTTGLGELGKLEAAFPLLLLDRLSSEPKILVMERRQLGSVKEEAVLTSDDKMNLRASGIVVDGELAPTVGMSLGKDNTPVTFTLRMRNTELKELARVSKPGRWQDLDALCAEAATAATAKLRELTGVRVTGSTSQESASLLRASTGELWPAEAAYALTPTNITARDDVIRGLIRETQKQYDNISCEGELPDGKANSLKQASFFARAERLCRENDLSFVRYLPPCDSGDLISLRAELSEPYKLLDPLIRELLQPARQTIRRETEKSSSDPTRLMAYAPMFFDNPLDTMAYTRALFDKTSADTNKPAAQRYPALVKLLSECMWTPKMIQPLTNSPDSVIRFFASLRAIGMTEVTSEREGLVRRAYSDMGDVVANHPDLWRNLDPHSPLFPGAVRAITNTCPDLQEPVKAMILSHLDRLADEKDLAALVRFRPDDYLTSAEPESAVRWIDRLEGCKPSPSDWPAREMMSRLQSFRHDLVTKYHVELRNDSVHTTHVVGRSLVTSDDPRWTTTAGTLWPPGKRAGDLDTGIIPQRCLVDGDVVWIALGGGTLDGDRVGEDQGRHSTGLMRVRWKTGEIMSCRYGKLLGNWVANESSSGGTITPMFKWKNHIGFGQRGLGLVLFPVDVSDQKEDLDGVTLVSVKDGLPSYHIRRIAPVADNIYMELLVGRFFFSSGVKLTNKVNSLSVLMEWNSLTRDVSTIGSASQYGDVGEMTGLNADGTRKIIMDISAAPSNRAVNVSCTLFRLRTAVGSEQSADYCGRAVWAYCPGTKSWTCISSNYARPTLSTNHVAYKALPPDLIGIRDVQDCGEGTLTIAGDPLDAAAMLRRGGGRNWKIEHFTAQVAADSDAKVQSASQKRLVLKGREGPSIVDAAEDGDLDKLEALLKTGADVNARDPSGSTPLCRAIRRHQSKAALWLVRHGANINLAETESRETPLIKAIWNEQDEVTRELLARHADLDPCNVMGANALSFAVSHGSLALYNELIDRGASPGRADNGGALLLGRAAWASRSDILRALLARGPNQTQLDSALTWAINGGSATNLAVLLEHGANINTPDEWGNYILINAAASSGPDSVRLLLALGAPGSPGPKSVCSSPLDAALYRNRFLNVRVLMEAGADPVHASRRVRALMRKNSRDASLAVYMEGLGNHIQKTFGDQTESAAPGK